MENIFSIEDKVVLLTGASGGIGCTLLSAFLERGAIVIATTRRDVDWGDLKEKYSEHFLPYKCDLANQEELKALISFAVTVRNGCDVLINNASECPHCTEHIYNFDLLRKTMAVTLDAPYFLCGQLAPHMAERGGGSIINITSMNAEMAWPNNPSYITAKGGLRMLTKAIARDYGNKGVRANNLCPGYIHTKLTDASFTNAELYEERRNRTMLGRWGVTADVVGPCIFLASHASAYVTGTDLHVEGGWLSKGL